jgi:membrane protein YdbS with pleckstrin-like domain
MDETETLTPLDPSYIKVMRIVGALFSVPLLIGAATLEFAQLLPPGLIIIPLVLLLAYWVWVVPQRRYNRWGYDAGADRLRIERGYLFYSDTVVPFGRIQHIDVDQGPIERHYDLGTLSVHTAGTHGSTIVLPGVKHADALALRERIREYIKQAQG